MSPKGTTVRPRSVFRPFLLLVVVVTVVSAPRPAAAQQETIRGAPVLPRHTRVVTGEMHQEVDLYTGDAWLQLPLFELQGRGTMSFPIQLTYLSDVKRMEGDPNVPGDQGWPYLTDSGQASWVGMGWALEAPYFWAELLEMEHYIWEEGVGPVALDLDENHFRYRLIWNGIEDGHSVNDGEGSLLPVLRERMHWKVEPTFEDPDTQSGWIESYTMTDLAGNTYTFDHVRYTYISLENDEELVDYLLVPYRWDLTRIEDATGQNSITITYQDVTAEFNDDEELLYTQASYVYRITDDASGRVVEFVRENRTDYPGDGNWWSEIYEQQRLDYFVLKDSAAGTVRARYDFSYGYHSSGSTQKLLLSSVQQRHPSQAAGLPAWSFTYRSGTPNPGALEEITYPEGGQKTLGYGVSGPFSSSWIVRSVSLDHRMGEGDMTTVYAPLDSIYASADKKEYYHRMRVTPPDTVGSTEYVVYPSSSMGSHAGSFDLVLTYNSTSSLVEKLDYTPEDTTIAWRRYALIRSVTYQGSDSLVTDTEYHHLGTNGKPYLIREQVSPFRPRGYAAGPDSVDSYWRTRQIEYAFQNYSGMDADGTHQLEAIWKEVIREETRSTTYGNKTSPVSATWTTFAQYGSSYYYPQKEWVWTASTAAGDTTLPADPPTNTDEKVVVREVTSMDAYGHVLVEKDGEGAITKYYYGDNASNLSNAATGLQHRFLTGVRRLKGSSDDNDNDLITRTDWDGNTGLKTSEEDENSSFTYFTCDDYLRPSLVQNHSSVTLQRTDYAYARDLSGTGDFDSTRPNYVRTVRFFTYGGSTDSTHTTEFTDGLGRKIQTHLRHGTYDIISSFGYYPDGAIRAEYTPYELSNASHAYHNTAYAYGNADSTLYEYESDPRRRPYRTTFPTMDTESRPQVSFSYGIEAVDGHKYLTRARTDENSVAHKECLNRDGTVFEQSTASDYESKVWRDALGSDYIILPPRTNLSMSSALGTLITYGRFGREIQRGEPDQGTTRTVYDRALRPIWVQEAADAAGDDFWATIYDVFGRPTRIGKEQDQSSSWFSRVPTAPTGTYGEEADEWRKKYTYDADAFGSGTTYPKGRLTKYEGNWNTDSTVENHEWYQYAREGWITKVRQAVAGFDTTDTDYEYDTGGRLRKVSYDSGSSTTRFFLWYDYDSAGRLYRIYHATSDSKPGTATTEYTWNARGQVSQQVLGSSVQTVDYTYNDRGFLSKINDPASIGTDRFAMELGYDAKVTGGPSTGWSAQYNGNISQIRWINTKILANPFYYTFGYDSRDQLTAADRDSAGEGGTWGDVTYAYDDNGNFTTLNRGTSWTYNYNGDEANTNRVDDLTGRGSDDNWDYDDSGRQTKDTYAGFSSATYHFPGAAFHDITMSGGTLQMCYGKDNRRLQKKNTANGGITTDYVRDLEGRVLAVFEDNTLVERYVWGPYGLVAIIKGTNSSPTTYYTLNDHLGYVRTVVSTVGTAMAAYDYYPYGKELRSSVDSGAGSRFRFGAKEYDTNLSLNLYYFEARFYNPEIGRFVAPDPARIGWSYYCFANNNPLGLIDPSGNDPQRPPTPYGSGPVCRVVYDPETGETEMYNGDEKVNDKENPEWINEFIETIKHHGLVSAINILLEYIPRNVNPGWFIRNLGPIMGVAIAGDFAIVFINAWREAFLDR